jgi:prepilin-type N-terminal cleavage/methylation domain-containing protein
MVSRAAMELMPILSAGNSRGVTLIEMVVVLAIIGLIAAITAPSVANGIESVRLVTASDDVTSFLNSAVNRTERRQQPVELVMSAKENSLKLYSTEANFSRELKLPDGISLEMPEDPEGVHRLIIMPGDTVPGIAIQIANRRGSRRIIHLDPMTGFPRVESVETK